MRRSSARSRCQKPANPTIMIAISNSLIQRISRDFSTLSASWPAVAENSTNGAMNTAPARLTSALGIERGERRGMERDEDDQRVLVDVVVARAQELRPEERREAAFAQEVELAGLVHSPFCPQNATIRPVAAAARSARAGPPMLAPVPRPPSCPCASTSTSCGTSATRVTPKEDRTGIGTRSCSATRCAFRSPTASRC